MEREKNGREKKKRAEQGAVWVTVGVSSLAEGYSQPSVLSTFLDVVCIISVPGLDRLING